MIEKCDVAVNETLRVVSTSKFSFLESKFCQKMKKFFFRVKSSFNMKCICATQQYGKSQITDRQKCPKFEHRIPKMFLLHFWHLLSSHTSVFESILFFSLRALLTICLASFFCFSEQSMKLWPCWFFYFYFQNCLRKIWDTSCRCQILNICSCRCFCFCWCQFFKKKNELWKGKGCERLPMLLSWNVANDAIVCLKKEIRFSLLTNFSKPSWIFLLHYTVLFISLEIFHCYYIICLLCLNLFPM